MRPKQMTTVGEIRRLLDGYPDDLPVDFSPITAAWLGTMGALRATDQLAVYDRDGESCGPLRPGAYLTMYLYEEEAHHE